MSDETRTLDLYDVHQGLIPRDGGPYLDEIEREKAEIQRARVEGREPDLKNPPATAGTQLVPAATLLAVQNSNSRPSQEHIDHLGSKLPDVIENKPAVSVEVTDLSKFPEYNPADPTVASSGSVNDGDEPEVEDSPEPEVEVTDINGPGEVTDAAEGNADSEVAPAVEPFEISEDR